MLFITSNMAWNIVAFHVFQCLVDAYQEELYVCYAKFFCGDDKVSNSISLRFSFLSLVRSCQSDDESINLECAGAICQAARAPSSSSDLHSTTTRDYLSCCLKRSSLLSRPLLLFFAEDPQRTSHELFMTLVPSHPRHQI